MMRRRLTLVATLAGLGLLVAACSSSGGGSAKSSSAGGGSSAAAGGGTTRGVTATSIKVGCLSTIKAAGGGTPFPGLDDGAKARFTRANSTGELGKVKINYIGCQDDGADQTRDGQLAHQLVQNDKVFAVLPYVTQVAAGSGDFLNQQHTPFIGWGFTNESCTAYGIGDTGCGGPTASTTLDLSLTKPLATALGGSTGKTAAVFSENFSGSTANADNMVKCLEAAGYKVVLNDTTMPPDSAGPITDFSPYVQKVLSANGGKGVDLVINNTEFDNAIGLTAALKAAGFKGAQANFVAYVPGLLTSSPDVAQALNGTYIVQEGTGAQIFGGSSWDKIATDLKAIGASTDVQLGTIHGYASADMFVDAIKELQTEKKPITGENFSALFNSWTYPGLGDAIGAVHFPSGRTSANNCSSVVKVQDGKYVPAADLTCGAGLLPKG
jgi:branched-chain amino acid transport system substrate-binding protein